MSHLVTLTAPQSGAHTVKKYAGFGILGADIPATGDSGGSPILNDGPIPTSEYYWRITSQPTSGVLTIFPDLSHEYDPAGAANGDYQATYELFEDRVSAGTAPLNFHVGPYFVAAADSQQISQASAAGIIQAHLVGAADSQQINTADPAAVLQPVAGSVLAADSQQINVASAAAIIQTHLIGIASSQQINRASPCGVTDPSSVSTLTPNARFIIRAKRRDFTIRK